MTQAQEIMVAGFDLDQLDANTEEVLHKVVVLVDDEGNDKSGFFITSKNSTEYQEASRKVRVDGLKRSSKRKTVLDASTDEGANLVAKLIDTNEMSLALSVVKGWFGFDSNGKAATFDKATVSKMFTKFPTWKDKVTAALENEGNFLKR